MASRRQTTVWSAPCTAPTFEQAPFQTLLGALVAKYGEPLFAVPPERGGRPYFTLSWSRDRNGTPIRDRAALDKCSKQTRYNDVKAVAANALYHTDAVESQYADCGLTLVVTVPSNTPDITQALVGVYNIVLYDGNAVRRYNQATLDFAAAEADKIEQQRLQKAREADVPAL